MRGFLIGVHIADIHFAAFDPAKQYKILKEQFFPVVESLPKVDLISVDGDLYDHKLMGNSDGLYYASLFVSDIIDLAKRKGSTVILIHGTFSHDADQLKNFYHYLNDPEVDIRIVTSMQYLDVHGARILCIPELYGIDESIYYDMLHYRCYYDECFIHGTFEGSVYGNNVGNGRLFTMQDFDMCQGFIIGGHVHKPGCHQGYFYYCGNPYRWKFGEEESKGFLITTHDLDTHKHYVHFQEIISDTYITIPIDDIKNMDAKMLIAFISGIKKDIGADYLKIKFNTQINGTDKTILTNYYKNSPNTYVEFLNIVEEKRLEQKKNGMIPEEYEFLVDNKLTDMEKFVMYVNKKEGSEFISIDKLKSILSGII